MTREFNPNLICTLVGELGLSREEIENMSRDEIFDSMCNYLGFVHCSAILKKLVEQVYGIDLFNWTEYLAPESVAKMEGLEEY